MLLDTPLCDFGWQAPDFKLNDFNGLPYELGTLVGENGVLIAFICNHCPYVQAIIDRLVQDTQTLGTMGVNVVGIMSNDYHLVPSDSPAEMKNFVKQHNISFPYLVDEDQIVAKAYGAVCTPDFYGFNNKAELQYRGRLDNIKMNANAANRQAELVEAMKLVAETGQGPKNQTPSMGCSIKWSA